MTSELQKQIFRENKAKKMPLKHFCRPRPYFLSFYKIPFPIDLFWIDAHCAKKISLLAHSGAEILMMVEATPHPHATHNNQGVGTEKVKNFIL